MSECDINMKPRHCFGSLAELGEFFMYNGWPCRAIESPNKRQIIIKVHPQCMDHVKTCIEDMAPHGVRFVYRPLNMLDYWKLRKVLFSAKTV